MARLRLRGAEKVKEEVMKKRKEKIEKLYKEVAKEIDEKLAYYSKLDTATGALRTKQLSDLKKSLEQRLKDVNKEIESGIISDVEEVSGAVQTSTNKWLKEVKFEYMFANVPDDVVNDVLNGVVYNKKNFLSKRIWNITKKELNDINKIVAKGIAENKSTYDIAKDLEKYVNPTAKKKWDWSKVYPGTNRKIDYNAQRLARTLVQHAFQKSFERVNEKNPFVKGYIWLSALAHGRTCEVCRERNGKFYKKGELPLDHPNGLCTWAVELKGDLNSIADDIVKWNESPKGTYPDIDKFAEYLEKR